MTRSVGASAARFLASFAIALLVIYAFVLGGGWSGIYLVGLRLVSLACIAGVLAVWALVAILRPALRPRSAIWPALVVPLAALALSTALSRSPRVSVEYLAWSVLLVALYLLLQRLLADDHFRPRLMDLTVALCAALGVVYLAVCFGEWLRWWDLVGHLAVPPLRPGFARLTFGNPSAVMTIQVLLWASAVARLGTSTNARRAAVVLLSVLTLAVTLLSGSRAGWLGLAVAVVVLAVAWLLVGANRAAVRRRVRSRAAVGALAVGVVAVAGAAAILAPALLSRLLVGGEAVRASYFAAAWRMALDSPVVGSGPGMWVAQRIVYTPAPETDYYIPHAHDIYLQTFAESGLVGLAAGVVAVACLLWLIVRAIRSDDPVRGRFGWCALFATAYFGAHQILDFYPNMPAALVAFAIPIAWLDAASDRSILAGPSSARVRRLGGAALAAASLASIGVLGWSETSAMSLDTAVRSANAGDWTAALAPATAAASRDPDMPAGQLTLGLAAARAGDAPTAERAFASVAASDDLPVAWLDLAAVQVDRGETDAARASLERALRLGDQQAAVALGAGDLYLRMGDREAALRAFADRRAARAQPGRRSVVDVGRRDPGGLAAGPRRRDRDGVARGRRGRSALRG